MKIERDADDIARCFALERLLYEERLRAGLRGRGHRADLGRRVRRVRPPRRRRGPRRRTRGCCRCGAARAERAERRLRGGRAHARGRQARWRGERAAGDGERDWWELNEQGTILRGERTRRDAAPGRPAARAVARVDTLARARRPRRGPAG